MQLSKHYRSSKSDKITRVLFEGHPFIVPVVTFLVLFFVSAIVFVSTSGTTVGASDSRIVNVTVDGESQTVPSRAHTVGELLDKLDIDVNEADIVEPVVDSVISDDEFNVNVYRARPITIVDGGHTVTTLSATQEPRRVVEKAGIKVYPEDVLRAAPPPEALDNGVVGEQVVIERATPMTVNLYGNLIKVRTHATSVEAVLAEKGISLLQGDTVEPSVSSPVRPHLDVIISRFGTKIRTKVEVIPPPERFVDDANLVLGKTVVRKPGVPGRRLVTYEIKITDGKEGKRKALQSVVAEEPEERVIARGTKIILAANLTGDKTDWMAAVGIPASQYQYVDYILSRESGWCPTKWQGHPGACPKYYQELYNPTSMRGYGLCQSTPASKMATMGSDWQTNPVTQLKWCNGYAVGRYGSWKEAYLFWSTNHWW